MGTAPDGGLGFVPGMTISTHVSDLHKAVEWYGRVLGFEPIYVVDELGWAELKSPTAHVAIGLSQVESPKTTGPVPVFDVADIEHTRGELESRGVRFDGATQTIPDMVRLATFYDPDGNAYMLAQSLAEGGAS